MAWNSVQPLLYSEQQRLSTAGRPLLGTAAPIGELCCPAAASMQLTTVSLGLKFGK